MFPRHNASRSHLFLLVLFLFACYRLPILSIQRADAQAVFRPTGITLLPPTVFDPVQAPAFTGSSPFERVRFCARNGLQGLIISVRLSLDGVPVVWPDSLPDGVSNTFLPCEQLLWEELAFTDTIPFQDGIQPPVPLESLVQSAEEYGVTLILRADENIPATTWRSIESAFPGIQWEGEYCGLVTPSIGLRPSPEERWTNPFLLWQDLLFIPRPCPIWRVGDPRILLTLCGVQANPGLASDKAASPLTGAPQSFSYGEQARIQAEEVQEARKNWLEAPLSTRDRIDQLLASASNRSSEESKELTLLLRTFAAPAPDIVLPLQKIQKAASDPDDGCFALALAALAKAAPLDVQTYAPRAWRVLQDANASEQTRLAILWAIGESGFPSFFDPIAKFAESRIAQTSSPSLEFAFGALSRLISMDGAAQIEPWVTRLPPGAHNAVAWCLGQHLPEEAARRAMDQLLDLPGVGTEAKGTALLAMRLFGGPDEIRRLCALLAHGDPIVAQDAMFLLLDAQPDLLKTPLTQTIKASAVLPSASALAITICGLMESPVLVPALQALPQTPKNPTLETLTILRDWATRKIQRQPGGDGLWGAPETLAAQQTQSTRLITELIEYNEPLPCLLGQLNEQTTQRPPLIPIAILAQNVLEYPITITSSIDVPAGEAWQIIPRERTSELSPGGSESLAFRLRAPANNTSLPQTLFTIESDEWSQHWAFPAPSQCNLPRADATPASLSGADGRIQVAVQEWPGPDQNFTLLFHVPITSDTATASFELSIQTDADETWPARVTVPVVRHGQPLASGFSPPDNPVILQVDRRVQEGAVVISFLVNGEGLPSPTRFAMDYMLISSPMGIDRLAQRSDLSIQSLGIGSLAWPPCPSSLMPKWTPPSAPE
jgi:hypothetical protein